MFDLTNAEGLQHAEEVPPSSAMSLLYHLTNLDTQELNDIKRYAADDVQKVCPIASMLRVPRG